MASGVYTFSTAINVPDNFDPNAPRLKIRCLADDTLPALHLGRQQVAGPFGKPIPGGAKSLDQQFQLWTEVELNDGIVRGENPISSFDVNDDEGPVGLRVEFDLTRVAFLESSN